MSDAAALAAFVGAQRWSGARGERLTDARVEAAIPVESTGATCIVLGARVAGRHVRYQTWLHHHEGASLDAVVARGALADATHDAALHLGLVRLLADGSTRDGTGARLVAEPLAGASDELRALSSSRVLSAEQSNTSIVYDDRVILKLFRRLEPGVQPDVEVTAFLTRRGFAHVPALLGTLSIDDASGAAVAAMAQRFVPGARDAWAFAVDRARAAVAGDAPPREYADGEARRLGAVTRALHDALASDADDADFAPRRAEADTVARWAAAASESVEQGVALLRERLVAGALDALPDASATAARGVADAGVDAVVATVNRLAAKASHDAGAATRHHGDYHLGQVLRAPDDGALFVIDFEGEPSRALEVRRARHCPLRDVAGMLRSFAYAGATAALDRPDDAAAAERARTWEAVAREAFLDGYFGDGAAAFLPAERASADALLAMFELEKAFYELAYELRNRPTWVPIPLAGIARLAGA
ncbi:MAG: hypothetical protein JO180_10800 [Gemmatirosa sp.]|nr:hypothetical protein [Gemmatirosa sp.]